MRKFFSYDGWFLRILTKAGELIILDVLFLLCCIPIVTIGPAITSLYYTAVKCVRRDCGSVTKEFFSSMKRVIGPGIAYTVVLALWIAALIFARDYATNGESIRHVMLYISDFLIVLTAAFMMYLFPVLSRFSVKTGKILQLSFAMSMRFFYFTLVMMVGTAIVIYILVNGIIPAPCLLFLPAFWCFGCSFMVEPALLAYMPPREEGDEAWYYPPVNPEREAKKAERIREKETAREEAKRMREERRERDRRTKMRKAQERGTE